MLIWLSAPSELSSERSEETTMTQDQKIIRTKFGLFELAKQGVSISPAGALGLAAP